MCHAKGILGKCCSGMPLWGLVHHIFGLTSKSDNWTTRRGDLRCYQGQPPAQDLVNLQPCLLPTLPRPHHPNAQRIFQRTIASQYFPASLCSPDTSQNLLTAFVRALNGTAQIKFVNTSMHGVSDRFVAQAFSEFGFAPYIPVKEQQQPDPEFPTVRFPNPEEKGVYTNFYTVALED